MIFSTIVASILVAFAFMDARRKLLPIEPMMVAALGFAIANLALHRLPWTSVVMGIAIGAIFFELQVMLSNGRWMGEGDPYLAACIGAAVGAQGMLWTIYLTYTVGAVLMLILWFFHVIRRGVRIPFAPMLVGGALLTLWFQPALDRILASLLR